MDPEPNNEKTFSHEYVSELRQENASWRTKLRDQEATNLKLQGQLDKSAQTNTISGELNKRGINANAEWIKLEPNQSPAEAVDIFLKDYPGFSGKTEGQPVNLEPSTKAPVKPEIPGVNKSPQKTNVPPPSKGRDVMELAKDPVAREKVRDHYRSLLRGQQ